MNKENNFDLLRLVFALIVFLVHSVQLTQNSMLAPLDDYLNSGFAVSAFFVISGFLILLSYERSTSLKEYYLKRMRRIYPAYCTIIILCAVLGVWISQYPLATYFNIAWCKYLAANLVFLNFLQPGLPGVFTQNTITAINGALWTIKIEVMFYLILPLIAALCRRFKAIWILSLIYSASVVWLWFFNHLALTTGNLTFLEVARQLPGQMAFFAMGMLGYYYFNLLEAHSNKTLLLTLVGLISLKIVAMTPLFPLILGTMVIYAGYFFKYMGNAGRYGDLSYGVYIVHFPILQVLIHYRLFDVHPWRMLALTTLVVLGAAFLSWHLIEKRWLDRRSHYRLVEQPIQVLPKA